MTERKGQKERKKRKERLCGGAIGSGALGLGRP